MSSIFVLLLAGTVVSTGLKVGILVVGIKAYRDKLPSTPQGAPEPVSLISRSKAFVQWSASRFRSPPKTAALQLQEWVQRTLPVDDGMSAWLTRLPASEAQVLMEDLTVFCETWQIDVAWLFAPPPAPFAEFHAHLETLVIAYCRARWTAQQMVTLTPSVLPA